MSAPIAYGIDFGTSNSAIAAFLSDDTIEVIQAEEASPLLPSLLYLNRDGNRLAGSLAADAFLISGTERTRCRGCDHVDWVDGQPLSPCRQVRSGSFCMDARLLQQVKSALADDMFEGTHSWGTDFSVEDLVAVVLRGLKRTADGYLGADVRRLAIGHPVRFAGAEGPSFASAQALAESRLVAAAKVAGFEEVVLVPESQAAIALDGISEGFVVCTDFGGGTFDCAIADVMGDEATVLGLDGVAVGGEDYDTLLFEHYVSPAIGLDKEFDTERGRHGQLPARLRRRLRSLSGLRSLLTDPDLAMMLSGLRDNGGTLRTISELLYGGQALAFYRAIESAKIELSTSPTAKIYFRRPWIDLDLEIRVEDFETLIAPSMDRIRDCLLHACAAANLRPEDVEFVTKTGGSSQIPTFGRTVSQLFPNAQVIQSDPFTSVVHGLAEYAGGEWSDV